MVARPDILNHNLETVRRLLKPMVASALAGERSLHDLASAKEMAREIDIRCTPSRA